MGWHFPDANGGQTQGFNDSSIDTFKGSRLQSLIRETIQNSLDARISESSPIRVDYSFIEVDKKDCKEITELVEFLKYAQQAAKNHFSEEDESVKFYKNAIARIQSEKVVPFFCIHDYNTRGLEGATDEDSLDAGPWKALVKSSGFSLKRRSDALGSFGHGSKATFAISQLRSVFYYSEVQVGKVYEKRYQGKSILQSMNTGQIKKTQGVGYFGHTEKCEPLIDSEIPQWAPRARGAQPRSTGTSIFVPFPDISIDTALMIEQIELAILANFYYAILQDNLEVSVNGQLELSSKNLREKFDKLLNRIELRELSIERELNEMLESAKTIHNPDRGLHGKYSIEGFGETEFFMRVGQNVEGRNVGIARQNGMLLSRRPLYLTRFSGTRSFDLFVCVSDPKGSEFLRRLENPAHNNFELDRVNNPEERKQFRTRYKQFTDEIRNLIEKHAGLDASEEIVSDDLDDFLGSFNEMFSELDGTERSTELVVDEKKIKVKSKTPTIAGEDFVEVEMTAGDGVSETKGGVSDAIGGQLATQTRSISLVDVNDPRLVRTSLSKAKIFFTPGTKEPFWLKLFRSGNQLEDELSFKVEGDSKTVKQVYFKARSRIRRESIVVELRPKDFEFALTIVIVRQIEKE